MYVYDDIIIVYDHSYVYSYMYWYCSLGYSQAMSDMSAPILYVVDDDVDAFWCFVGLMERMVSINWSTVWQ